MEGILDSNQPLDVSAFDSIVAMLSTGTPAQIMEAQAILTKFKQTPDAFYRVDKLLNESHSTSTKFLALQILNEAIFERWNSIDEVNQQAIRAFIINLIAKECGSFQQIRSNRALLTKLNSTLVSIAKREYPVRWPNFIQDISTSAGPDQPMVENNLSLLRLVGEEVFQFGDQSLTSRWVERKKAALADDFNYIMQLCGTVLTQSQDSKLLKIALETLTVYVPWMAPSAVLQEEVIARVAQFVVGDEFVRTDAVRCFTEMCSKEVEKGAHGDAQAQLVVAAYRRALQSITAALPTSHSSIIERIAQLYDQGNSVDEAFVRNLNLLITGFLRNHYSRITYDDELLITSHQMLVGMSSIDEKELFKSCMEYWWWLSDHLLRAPASHVKKNLMAKLPRILSDVRFVVIKKMPKPEEVVIVEVDGEVRREEMTNVEQLELYELMRETLVFLTNLDNNDTRNIMISLMNRLLDRSEWSWQNCNTLSWAVGAISHTMAESVEDDLFVKIIKGLLTLCKEMNGQDSKAVIAADIMFVVGQYTGYLNRHSRFLVTVCNKVFEFMHISLEGVKDMAVDTFVKLAKRVAPQFVMQRPGERMFAEQISDSWSQITAELSKTHIETCYAAVGCMVAADAPEHQAKLLFMFLNPINERLDILMAAAKASNGVFCLDANVMAELLHYLRIYSAVAGTCGDAFIHELSGIIQSLYYCYGVFSEAQALAVAQGGQQALLGQQEHKYIRLAKREILRIFEYFVTHSKQLDFVATSVMPDVFTVVLNDYEAAVPQAKEAGALALAAACVRTLNMRIAGDCGAILDKVFNTTVAMISPDLESYPDFRVNLFKLLQALNECCFEAFVQYAAVNAAIIEGMLWAIQHKDYPTMSTALTTLDKFLENVMSSPLAEPFYTTFIQRIFEEVIVVTLDRFHAAGFPFHCAILRRLFAVVDMVEPQRPVLGREAVTAFLHEKLKCLPTLTSTSIHHLLETCFSTYKDEKSFQTVIADFLIEVQVWGAEEENKLQEEQERRQREETIPGFANLWNDGDSRPGQGSSFVVESIGNGIASMSYNGSWNGLSNQPPL